ncbi:MAG: hypothetical protein ACI92Z_001907 [Paracoccaceae bacterium]|jgi:uncharacterized protein YjiS (DUF1127 family)
MAVTSHISASALGHPVNFLMGLTERAAQYINYRKTVRILSDLSRAELEDLGLGRGKIEQAAHKAVYGV